MFRRVEEGLPPDASYPADLQKLGYFINQAGQIRMIDYPDKTFQYYKTNIERHNEVHREAFQMCQRDEVFKRLSPIGIEKLYLPHLSNTKPDDGPHIPILAPPAEILKARKRIIVIINDPVQDLGILAYRALQREPGLNGGSIVNFAKDMIFRSTEFKVESDLLKDGGGVEDKQKDTPGLVVLNTGRLLFSYTTKEDLSMRSWSAKERKSITHDMIKIHEDNYVEGHRTPEEHIKTVFDNILHNTDFVVAHAEIYVIAIENGAQDLMNFLHNEIDGLGAPITALAIVNSTVDGVTVKNANLKAFLHQRARHWKITDATTDPRHCFEVPLGYDAEIKDSDKQGNAQVPTTPSWLETASPSGPIAVSLAARSVKPLSATAIASVEAAASSSESAFSGYDVDPICPGFGGGDNTMGEIVFTDKNVQKAILEFFEEVAKNPKDYRNPGFNPNAPDVPHPTAKDPLEFRVEESAESRSLPAEVTMTPEQQEIATCKEDLRLMEASLENSPKDSLALVAGNEALKKRIAKKGQELEDLQKKALAMGGLGAGEAQELRDEVAQGQENWVPAGIPDSGPKIGFAGTKIGSDLAKSIGMMETVDRQLDGLDSGNEGA